MSEKTWTGTVHTVDKYVQQICTVIFEKHLYCHFCRKFVPSFLHFYCHFSQKNCLFLKKKSHPWSAAGELVHDSVLLHEALPSLLEVERGDEADVVTLLQPGLPPARVLATHHLKQVTSCTTQQRPLDAGWLVSPI